MNIILFNENEVNKPLPIRDSRAIHLLKVLKMKEGDSFDVGLVDGPRGKASIVKINRCNIQLQCVFQEEVPQLPQVTMLIGLPRPPSARRILRDITSQGVQELHFVVTDKGEESYLNSRLWSKDEYLRLVREGAEQAFCTRQPTVSIHDSLLSCLDQLEQQADRLVLDNYEASLSLGEYRPCQSYTILAVGAERGWSATERDLFRQHHFLFANMGERVLRTETACIAGLAIVLEKHRALSTRQ